MVRRGSTVRVRQRASRSPCRSALSVVAGEVATRNPAGSSFPQARAYWPQHAGAVGCHADEGAAVREEERCAAAAVGRRSDEPAARDVPEAQLSVRAATRDRR